VTTGGEINETEAVQHRTLSSFFFFESVLLLVYLSII